MIRLTYYTPTWNRDKLLKQLYDSLCQQTNKDFIWLIVDDGSTDKTKDVADEWIKEGILNIKYVYKENGGKNTGIDIAHQMCDTEFIMCVDSDDFLSTDATEVLYNYFDKIQDNSIVGLVGRRAHYDGTPFNKNWATNNDVICFYNIKDKYGYSEDTTLIFKTDIVKRFHFPKIQGERFITESVLYQQFLYDYKLMMFEECIYLAEYQEVGYTSQGLDLFLKNPKGFLYSLWVDAFYAIKTKKPLKRRLGIMASYYAWKKVLKQSTPIEGFKINWLYRLFGKCLLFKLYKSCKEQNDDFIQRRNNSK